MIIETSYTISAIVTCMSDGERPYLADCLKSLLEQSEPLGEIMSIHGHVVERPTLAQDVIIIGIRVDPVVHTGDRVAYVAYEWADVAP